MSKTILLTGATGYLGSHLLSRFLSSGYEAIALKRSSSKLHRVEKLKGKLTYYDVDRIPLSEIFEANKIDLIVHCAVNYGRHEKDPSALMEANLLLPLNLLQRAAVNGTTAFINTDTALAPSTSNYALSKSQFRDWLEVFSKKLLCINMTLEHFYGPLDDTSKFVSKIVFDLLKPAESIDLTEGRQKRDFVFIDDVVEAYSKIIETLPSKEFGLQQFEVGSGKAIEIRELVQEVKAIANNTSTRLNFGALPYRESEVMESKSDISAMKKLGWSPKVSLQEGIKKTIEIERAAQLAG